MLKYYVVDAFADNIFEGNPAGVCILDEWIPMEKMEKIAIENNLSETAFAVKVVLGYKCGHKNVESVKLKARKDVSNIEQAVYRRIQNDGG